MSFRELYDFDRRYNDSRRILLKYPDRIPVIVECGKNVPSIDKHKYLVPRDLTAGQFLYVLRKRMELKPEQALFLFVENILPPTSSTLSEIYNKYKEEDQYLYITLQEENTFG